MTINTDTYTNGAAKGREATEKAVDTWRQGIKQFTERADLVSQLPTIDLTEPVTRYFDFVQQAVDLNRQLATQWAELLSSFAGNLREQAEKVGSIMTDQVDSVADLA